MLFFRQIQHLLPRAEAWRIVVTKTLRKFFEGLAQPPQDAKDCIDAVFEDAFPETTRHLEAWEKQFGIQPNASEAARRQHLAAEWAATGGQSPAYIEGVLQTAGFDVYVHEWWASGPPYVPRDPRTYTQQPLIGDFQCSALPDQPQCSIFSTQPQCSAFLANETGYIVNLDLTRRPPPRVTDDASAWPYFLYIAGESFPDYAHVPVSRRAEFERLLLKLCPAQQWLVTRVYFEVDLFELTTESDELLLTEGDEELQGAET